MIDVEAHYVGGSVNGLSLPEDWRALLDGQFHQPYWEQLQLFLHAERRDNDVYPPEDQVFAAFQLTSYEDTRVVILGQDPYTAPGQAHGLCFSVPKGVAKPRSLINIHRVLKSDMDVEPPSHGNLEGWARQGVLLLNTTLTVRKGEPGSHHGQGWERFTDEVIRALNEKTHRVVFLLWGAEARKRKKLIDTSRHAVLESGHPVVRPNAHLQFLNSHPFSEANRLLVEAGLPEINWASL